MASKLYYSFALNTESELTSIENANKGQEYFCPACGAPMIPKKGNKRCWHFAHKGNTHNCSYESYLHKLAKLRISECFKSSQHFVISFNSIAICKIAECPLGTINRCEWTVTKEFDLKEYYNTCEEEIPIGNFKADLLISDTNDPQKQPILIEIFVSHKSSEKKIKSGNRIIEIKIASEEDIDNIVSTSYIKESEGYLDKWETKPNDNIRFYNFKANSYEIPDYEHQAPKFRFWIDSRCYFKFDKIEMYDFNVRCLSSNPLDLENSIFRIESKEPIGWDFAFYNLAKSNIGIKYCTMCSYYKFNDYYGRAMCTLYKSRGTKQYPNLSEAMKCSYFKQINYQTEERLFEINKNQECKIYVKKINP